MGDPLTEDLIYDSAEVMKEDVPLNKIQFFGISIQHFTDLSILTKLQSLRVVQLRLCNIVAFPEEFFSIPSIESIDLSGNSIASLPQNIAKENNESEEEDIWQKLPNLTTLNLSENSLNDINEIFKIKALPKLKHLILTGNICLTAFNAFNRICEEFPKLLVLNDSIITSQHRGVIMNLVKQTAEMTIPLVDADSYIFLYVKYLRCSVNERYSRRIRAQFFCVNRLLRKFSSATKIQSIYRGYIERLKWQNSKQSALFLQTRIKFWCHHRSKAAMKIQGMYRCHKLRHILLEHRNARKIQGMWRRYLSRDNAIIDLFKKDEQTYQMYITNESLIKLYKYLEEKEINYSKSVINNSMLVEENDEFKVIRFGPVKKRNLPGSPAIYFNVEENILIRRNHNHKQNTNSIWCNHNHKKLSPVKQVSKVGVNFSPTCPFGQIKFTPYTKEIQRKEFTKYQTLKLITFTDIPLFRKIIKLVAHNFPEGIVLFPKMSLNEAASQFIIHCSARMFIARNREFHKMKKFTIEKRAAKCIKGFIRTRRITRSLSHFTKLFHYSDSIPEAMTFFVPQKFLNIVKLDFKTKKDLLDYEREINGNGNYTFKTEKTMNTHLMHSDMNINNNTKNTQLADGGGNKENLFRNRMKNLQKNDLNSFISLNENENNNNEDQNNDDFDTFDLDPSLKHGFPIKYPAVFGFTSERCAVLPYDDPNPFLGCFIPWEPLFYNGKSLSMLPTFGTTIRPALPSMFSFPISKKMIRIGRIMRITFSSPEEAFRRLFIFAYMTGDTSRFMIDTQVIEYCAALLIQNHWRGFLYRRDYRHLGAQNGAAVNPAILLKQVSVEPVRKKEDEPPPTFKKMVRKELPPEVAIANLRGDYHSWESLHRKRTINDLFQHNDKPYKSTIFPDSNSKKVENEDVELKTESMKNLGLVNDLENAYANLSEPKNNDISNEYSKRKIELKKQKQSLTELAQTTINGHVNEKSRKVQQTMKPPPFEVELETQHIFGPSLSRVKELDPNINTSILKTNLNTPKEAIKPIDTSEKAYESLNQFYSSQKMRTSSSFKRTNKKEEIENDESQSNIIEEEEEISDDNNEVENTFNDDDDDIPFKQKPSPQLTSTPRTPTSAGRPRVQFEVLKPHTASQLYRKPLNSMPTETTENQKTTDIVTDIVPQKASTPTSKRVTQRVKIDVLANTSKAIKKARPESAFSQTAKPKKIDPISKPSTKPTPKTPKSLIDTTPESTTKTPILKKQDNPQIRVPTPKLQTIHYKPPQMKNSEFTESLAAPPGSFPTTPSTGKRSKLDSSKTITTNSSVSSSTATLIPNSSLTDLESINGRPFTSLMITSPQWTDNTMRDALRRAFSKLVRLHQLGIEIEQAMVTDNTIAEKRNSALQAREKVVRAREELKVSKEEELTDLMERNKIEQSEREEQVRQVRAKTAMTRNRNVNKVRKVHKDAINKYKKERDFALNFVSVSRKIAQQIEQKQLKAEKRKDLEEAQSKVQKQHQESKDAIEKYKQKVRDMEDYKRKVASRDKMINEEKRLAQTEAAKRRIELLATIKEDEKLMKETYRELKNQRRYIPTNIPQLIETDEVEGASLIIKDFMGPNLGETESHLLCQIISEIV